MILDLASPSQASRACGKQTKASFSTLGKAERVKSVRIVNEGGALSREAADSLLAKMGRRSAIREEAVEAAVRAEHAAHVKSDAAKSFPVAISAQHPCT